MSIDPNGRKLLRIEARNAQTPLSESQSGLKHAPIWDLSTQNFAHL